MVRLLIPQAPFLSYGLTGFVIDPIEENRIFPTMLDEGVFFFAAI